MEYKFFSVLMTLMKCSFALLSPFFDHETKSESCFRSEFHKEEVYSLFSHLWLENDNQFREDISVPFGESTLIILAF